MRQIAIIADDLTGSSDAGVQFTRKGLTTSVLFAVQNLVEVTRGVDAVAVDTDSRAIPPVQAYSRVRDTAAHLYDAGFTHVLKKVDSTLRGNLGSEIDGLMDAIPFELAVVAPAFPRMGRTTRDGRHYLNGVPLHLTEIARDPKCPVTESVIVNLLGQQSRRKVGLVPLDRLRGGSAIAVVANLRRDGVQSVVFDAETDDDLQRIAVTMAAAVGKVLWVGSAGLADHLPQALGLTATAEGQAAVPCSGRPVLLVAGSISSITREQVAAYRREPGVVAVALDPLAVLATAEARVAELDRCAGAVGAALEAGHDVAFTSGSEPQQVAAAQESGMAVGLDPTEVSNRVAAALGEVAGLILNRHAVQGVILTGGDTARAVCRSWGATGLRLIRELEPGVPLSRLVGGRELLAVTKAGAFGNDQTLVRALHGLKGE